MASPSPSPFDHVLRTNYAPSTTELRQIKELIAEPEEQVRLLDEKIKQLQSERDRLQSFVDDHRALLSPARRLPRDIVAEIFLYCLPTNYLPVCDASKAPLVLTAICGSWREIAVTTPRLWQAIHFVFPSLFGYTIDEDFRTLCHFRRESLQLWLKRAGSLPLTISCHAQYNDKKPIHVAKELRTIYFEYVKILSRYSTQWKNLYLSSISRELLLPLQELKPNDVPLLSSLSLEANSFEHGRPWMSMSTEYPLLNIMRAPSLLALHLSREAVDIFTLPVQWSNLAELFIRSLPSSAAPISPVQAVQRLVRSCHSLRKCTLDLTVSTDDDVSVLPPRETWQHLSELRINLAINIPEDAERSHRVIQQIFDSISTPSLSHLVLSMPDKTVTMQQAPFLDLLQASECRLVSLELDVLLSSMALIGILQRIPTLSSLHLTDAPRSISYVSFGGMVVQPLSHSILTSEVFQTLSDKELCPLLESITFAQCQVEIMDDIVAFVLSRTTIKTLNITFQVMSSGSTSRDSYGLSDEQRAKGRLLGQHGISVKWRSMFDAPDPELRRPIVMDSLFANSVYAGMPESFGVY
ncbi:hypothetical protein VNI00_013824 [Paramarasmius palmivorus]|uniref:F-box domain-containing protein n=1 Tax=Paramarasmius palmivorus TaxID=297713 RepID=A0AAW0BVH6_9AGAR